MSLTFEGLWQGDWAKGIAGGYGTSETDWAYANNDRYDLKAGALAESWKWTVDEVKNEGAIVFQIRQGVHWALNPTSEDSKMVNGREVTTDDVLYSLKKKATDPLSYVYRNNPNLRTANITKTGPWEVTIKVPVSELMAAIARFSGGARIFPPEVFEKRNGSLTWQNSVGTGAFYIKDYVPGSTVTYVRNSNYWMKDPVGPGAGNQLPYLDGVKTFSIPDLSTRQAALRTGKIDQMSSQTRESAQELKKSAPGLLEAFSTSFQGRGNPPLNMRIDKEPFTDIRVRRAMLMAIDYNAILQGYFGGVGQIYTFPHSKIKDYQVLYLDFEDYPDSAKELYSYNPEKARQLLKEAGYPNGFKTSIITTSANVDFFAIYADYLSKIGVEMVMDVKETTVVSNIYRDKTHTQMIQGDTAPIAIFYNGQIISGLTSQNNRSVVDDPYINAEIEKIKKVALTDIIEAMKMYREMTKYVVDQAYAIPAVIGSSHTLWWPWLKNYSGEINVGYDATQWPQYVWYDQELKKAMGR